MVTAHQESPDKKSPYAHYYRNLPVLVTGGAGFIGSHLVERLIALGARVTVMDNLSTGTMKNLQTIANSVSFIHASITDFAACVQATQNAHVIFHLAAAVSVPASVEHPDHCYHTNVGGTLNLLEAAARNGVERLVFSSSSAVYGHTDTPCSEDMACHPQSPYGVSKLVAEQACRAYAHRISTVCLRYFNVYGERQNPHGEYAAVVAKFKSLIARNQPITIFGDGLQTRDFISIDNVVDANLSCGMLAHQHMNGDAFNIANGTSMTLLELVDQLKRETPTYREPLLFQPARAGDIRFSAANCTKYQTLLSKMKRTTA